MGYCKNQVDSSFFISADCIPKVIQAIKGIPKNSKSWSDGGYAWVSEYSNLEDIVELFRAWRYKIGFDNKGNIDSISFGGEKYGNCNVLFEAIAPFVLTGSFIEWRGEDGAAWRDVFVNGKYKEVSATITWG